MIYSLIYIRFIAILLVVLYHLNLQYFSFGYLGVDIFFILSGYLTVKKISTYDSALPSLVFISYLKNRFLRIYPPLLAVLSLVLIYSIAFFTQNDLSLVVNTSIYSILSLVNFIFVVKNTNYDDPETAQLLLHTWSLSVEFQFYLFFIVIYLLINKMEFNRKYYVGLFVLFIVFNLGSFFYGSIDYFSTEYRIFQFLAGVLVFLYKDRIKLNYISIFSLILVTPFIYFLKFDINYHPGVDAIFFTFYFTLIMFFALSIEKSVRFEVYPFLNFNFFPASCIHKIILYIASISYSIYLIHFPLFFIIDMDAGFNNYSDATNLIIKLSILLLFSSIIHKLFEVELVKSRISILLFSFFSIALILFLYMYVGSSIFSRYDAKQHAILHPLDTRYSVSVSGVACHNRTKDFCTFPSLNGSDKNLYLVGDSHAATLMEATLEKYQLTHNVIFMTLDGCPLLKNFQIFDINSQEDQLCTNAYNLRRLSLINVNPGTVILSSRLPLYTNEHYYNNGEGGVERGAAFYRKFISINNSSLFDNLPGLYSDIAKLNKLILIYPVPPNGFNVGHELRLFMNKNYTFDQDFLLPIMSTSKLNFINWSSEAYDILDSVSGNVLRIYPEKLLCETDNILVDRCFSNNDKVLYYFDDDHLSQYGANKIIADIVDNI